MAAYANVGAKIQEDISEASCIFGVKQVTAGMFVQFIATPCTWSQVPIDALLSNKTFCFFSHTIKAQPDNMDLLDAMLEKNVRSNNLTSSVWNTIPDWNEPSVANVTTNTQSTAGVLTMRQWWMPKGKEL